MTTASINYDDKRIFVDKCQRKSILIISNYNKSISLIIQ